MEKEIWRPIPGYRGIYDVSNHGRIRSNPRKVKRNRAGRALHTTTIKGCILKPRPNPAGYCSIYLCRDGNRAAKMIHRLVAEAFIDSPTGKGEVNHIDGDKANNRASNLEWVNNSENKRHSYKIGLRPTGTEHHFSSLGRDGGGHCIRKEEAWPE